MIRGQFRMTPRLFRRAARAGLYADRKVELLGGIVFEMTPNAPHFTAVHNLSRAIRRLAPEASWFVTKEDAIAMGTWLPAPDLAVLRGPWEAHQGRLPRSSDVALLVEVSDTTYRKDRFLKYSKYASRSIPAYWIVDLSRRAVEVHTTPRGRGRSASYGSCVVFQAGDDIPVVLDGQEVGRIAADELLS